MSMSKENSKSNQLDTWNNLKKSVSSKEHKPPFVSERDLWWVNVGENVGSEINGKSDQFSRPVIIFKKLSHGFYFVVPTTTQHKEGSWFVSFTHKSRDMFACLHQAKALDYRRLSNKLGQLDTTDFDKIDLGFTKLYCTRSINKYSPSEDGAAANAECINIVDKEDKKSS